MIFPSIIAIDFNRPEKTENELMKYMMRKILTAILILSLLSVHAAFAITLPASLKTIEDEAFYGTNLDIVYIPEGVASIGVNAFKDCGLQRAVLPETVISIGAGAFSGEATGFFALVPNNSYAMYWCKLNNVLYFTYSGEMPTPTPQPTAAPSPTASPTAAITPAPTTTPTPTPAATAVPTVTPSATPTSSAPAVSALTVSLMGDKYLGRTYSQMDCQAFVEQCLADAGLSIDLPGSNAWYRTMTWVGTPEECRAKFGSIPVGAFLYILEQNGREPDIYKADGIGNASHIGLYIGRESGAIHSSYSKNGVYYSYFAGSTINGGWNRVGLWNELDYGESVNGVLRQLGK